MDVVGAAGVEAEAELLAAITTFFARVGLTPNDVGLKVSSRKVLAAVLARYGVPAERFAEVNHRETEWPGRLWFFGRCLLGVFFFVRGLVW